MTDFNVASGDLNVASGFLTTVALAKVVSRTIEP